MSGPYRIIVFLSVAILRRAIGDAGGGRVDSDAVRLALYCLRRHCPDSPLRSFWDAARQLPHAGRADNCQDALEAILRELRAIDAYPDDERASRLMVADEIRLHGEDRERIAAAKRKHYWAPSRRSK